MPEPLIVEFPPDTCEIIDRLAGALKLSRVEVLSRGLGLLQLWVEAKENHHIIVERPAYPDRGPAPDEFEIAVEH
jgi:hypothetical protein